MINSSAKTYHHSYLGGFSCQPLSYHHFVGLAFLGFRHYLKGKDPAETASVLSHQGQEIINRIGISKEWVCTRNQKSKNHWSIEPMVLLLITLESHSYPIDEVALFPVPY